MAEEVTTDCLGVVELTEKTVYPDHQEATELVALQVRRRDPKEPEDSQEHPDK